MTVGVGFVWPCVCAGPNSGLRGLPPDLNRGAQVVCSGIFMELTGLPSIVQLYAVRIMMS